MKLGSSLVIAAVLTFAAAGFTQDVAHDTDKAAKDVAHGTDKAAKR